MRWTWVNNGNKDRPDWKARVAHVCENCNDREFLGCGFDDATRGKATVVASGDSTWATVRTCPESLIRTPYIQSLLEVLPHYKAGTIGNALHLGASDIACLAAYVQGEEEFSASLEEKVMRG